MEHCERRDTENDQDKSDCKKMTERETKDWSVVLYEESTVIPIHKRERKFTYSGHEFIIKQEWSKLGVAAVVWDAVRNFPSIFMPYFLLSHLLVQII